jgi:uncharacterized protein (TIGR03083 family)
MKVTPRYDDPGFLRFTGSLADPSIAMLRQRRRMAATVSQLDDAQLAAPSRCAGWSVQDVISHLVTVNRFFALAFEAARKGEPTRVLIGFDPVATPTELVESARSLPWSKVLDGFVESNEAIADAVAGLDGDGWSMLGEAPPGHVPLRAVAYHALWDCWIHERDVVLPLGMPPVVEADEVADSLRYVAALSPLFAVTTGSARPGSIVIDASDPDVRVVVDIVGDGVVVHDGEPSIEPLRLTGPAVDLIEGLSYRAPLRQTVADEHRWLFDGLGTAFDREPSHS